MLFVVHAIDKKDILPTRAKHYRDHRIHLDRAEDHAVDVVTAGTLLADDGETPVGSIFVIDATDRAAVDAFARSDRITSTASGIACRSTATTRNAAPRSRAGGKIRCFCQDFQTSSWPDLFRPSTSLAGTHCKTWMPRHRRGQHAVLRTAMRGHDEPLTGPLRKPNEGRPAGHHDATRGRRPAGQSLRTQEMRRTEDLREANRVPRARRASEPETRSAQHD